MIRNTPEPGLHILVVDDNPVHRRMSQTILSAAGYRVSLADGGAQAIAAFDKTPPDIVLLDVHMPGMNGFEVCQRLRALPSGKKVPIVFLTDVSDLASPDQAFSAGGDDFLNKPLNRIELLMRVRSLLRARHHEAILEEVLAEVAETVIVLDGKGHVVKWSRQATLCFGFHANEAVGRSLGSLILAKGHSQVLDDGITRYLSTGGDPIIPEPTALTAVHQGGRQFPIGLYVTAIRTANETAFCVFIRDAGGQSARGAT